MSKHDPNLRREFDQRVFEITHQYQRRFDRIVLPRTWPRWLRRLWLLTLPISLLVWAVLVTIAWLATSAIGAVQLFIALWRYIWRLQ